MKKTSDQKIQLHILCILLDDEIANSVASDIPVTNKQNQSQQTTEQTQIFQKVVSPEVTKLNQHVCNEQKTRRSNTAFCRKKPQEKDNGFITCQPLTSVDGLCYRIIY